MKNDDEERSAESRRILEGVERDGGGAIGSSFAARSAIRARDHFIAADAKSEDWAEIWGTRIGRVLALVAVAFLIGWLIQYLANT